MINKIRSKILLPVFLIFSACSCSTENTIQRILGSAVEPPLFIDCRPVSADEIVFEFSLPVRVVSLNFDDDVALESVGEGAELTVKLARPLPPGRKITADILVEDAGGNSLSVIVPFRARNDHVPAMSFNEIRTEYGSATRTAGPKIEFVEIKTWEPGNLGGARLFIAGHSMETPLYEFPPSEVKAGEYIVLHLRTLEEGCLDETGPEQLDLSAGTDAVGDARDFWIPGSKEYLRKTDGLWLMDQDGGIIDAVLLNGGTDKKGNRETFLAAAEFLGRENAWLPPDGGSPSAGWIPEPSDAVNALDTTSTRTVCRDNDAASERRAGNWYITANSSSTPGKNNNPKRYVKK